jgi:hypothetical protein
VTQVPRELWPIVYRLATSGDWPPRSDGDVSAFFMFANDQKLLPLLMADPDVPPVVAEAKPRFRALAALYRKRYELSRDAAMRLRGIIGPDAFLFLKGSDYRHRLYVRPELRPMADLDVYVPPAQVPVALELLAAAGCPRKYCDHGAYFAPGHFELSVEIRKVHVEIHRGFCQRVRARIDYAGLWQRREWFQHDGIGGYRLSAPDAVLAHAFELARDEFSSEILRYVDFYLLLQRYQDHLRECVLLAKAWEIERPLFGALHLTWLLFPSARPNASGAITDLLLERHTRRFLVDRVLPDPSAAPSGYTMGRWVQLWRKFLLMDRRWRWLAFIAYHTYATAIGSIIEWRLRRNGFNTPLEPGTGARA